MYCVLFTSYSCSVRDAILGDSGPPPLPPLPPFQQFNNQLPRMNTEKINIRYQGDPPGNSGTAHFTCAGAHILILQMNETINFFFFFNN